MWCFFWLIRCSRRKTGGLVKKRWCIFFFIYVRFFNKVWMSWLIRGWMWNSVAVCDVLRVVARYYRGGFSSQCHSFLLLGIRVTKGREGEKGDFRLLWQVWILLKRTSVKKNALADASIAHGGQTNAALPSRKVLTVCLKELKRITPRGFSAA